MLLETLSDHLTDLADLMLDNVLRLAWSGLRRKHRDEPVFVIVGYGKLGGKELGYASDLDIIFLYDDPHPDAPEIYARLSQRINSWLTSYTSAGLLYETDLRLRPNGSSGLLVSSIEAFDQYQRNHAWVWEHQALTRARFVAGDTMWEEAFERTREEVLRQRRELSALKREVLEMREKMLEAHPNSSGLFDVKHDRGGIIDVEFIVQYLILGHAWEHHELTRNIGNIALLKLASNLGLISRETGERALRAYREFRHVQHRLRLSGDASLTGLPSSENKSQKFVRVEVESFKIASRQCCNYGRRYSVPDLLDQIRYWHAPGLPFFSPICRILLIYHRSRVNDFRDCWVCGPRDNAPRAVASLARPFHFR